MGTRERADRQYQGDCNCCMQVIAFSSEAVMWCCPNPELLMKSFFQDEISHTIFPTLIATNQGKEEKQTFKSPGSPSILGSPSSKNETS